MKFGRNVILSAMMTDYKISSVVDDGVQKVMKVRFYEGEVTTLPERDAETRSMVPVTRYRRSKMIVEKMFVMPVGMSHIPILKNELRKDKVRMPIPELL